MRSAPCGGMKRNLQRNPCPFIDPPVRSRYTQVVNQQHYRRLESLVDEGQALAALELELEGHPLEERVELSRYAWGLLDRRYDSEREAALWLYAWSLTAEKERAP
jgi:hypothetical protein